MTMTARSVEWVVLPETPAGWRLLFRSEDGARWERIFTGHTLILSGSVESDGRRWLHMSLAHPSRLPSWDELRSAKEWSLGDIKAVQVLPPRREYVNIHPHCLHLFACIDADPLPDFTRGSGSL